MIDFKNIGFFLLVILSMKAVGEGQLTQANVKSKLLFYGTTGFDGKETCFLAPKNLSLNWSELAKQYLKNVDLNSDDEKQFYGKFQHYEPNQSYLVTFQAPLPEELANTNWTVVSLDGISNEHASYLVGTTNFYEMDSGPIPERYRDREVYICLESKNAPKNSDSENYRSRFVINVSQGEKLKPVKTKTETKISTNFSIGDSMFYFANRDFVGPTPRNFGFLDESANPYAILELAYYDGCPNYFIVYDFNESRVLAGNGYGSGSGCSGD